MTEPMTTWRVLYCGDVVAEASTEGEARDMAARYVELISRVGGVPQGLLLGSVEIVQRGSDAPVSQMGAVGG